MSPYHSAVLECWVCQGLQGNADEGVWPKKKELWKKAVELDGYPLAASMAAIFVNSSDWCICRKMSALK